MQIGKITPNTWYKEHISFEKPILKAYVEGSERQIEESIKDFSSRTKVVEEIEIPEISLYQVVTMVDGLDDMTYSFEAIFEDYFPQLQRQSSLITLYSFFEFEVLALCKMYDSSFDLRKYNASGSYLAKCLHFLTNTCGNKFAGGDPTWLLIDDGVRVVRNCIVHNQGAFPDKADGDYAKILNHLKEMNQKDCVLEEKGGGVHLNMGYVSFVLEAFDNWLKEVDKGMPT